MAAAQALLGADQLMQERAASSVGRVGGIGVQGGHAQPHKHGVPSVFPGESMEPSAKRQRIGSADGLDPKADRVYVRTTNADRRKVTWPVVNPRLHFVDVGPDPGGAYKGKHRSQCIYCDAVVVRGTVNHITPLKRHMGACCQLPADLRATLDNAAVQEARARMAGYGGNPVYDKFEVVGWMVARCKTCSTLVRGNCADLGRHFKRYHEPGAQDGATLRRRPPQLRNLPRRRARARHVPPAAMLATAGQPFGGAAGVPVQYVHAPGSTMAAGGTTSASRRSHATGTATVKDLVVASLPG